MAGKNNKKSKVSEERQSVGNIPHPGVAENIKIGEGRIAKALAVLSALEELEEMWSKTTYEDSADLALLCTRNGYSIMMGKHKPGFQGYFWENISGLHKDVALAISLGTENFKQFLKKSQEKKDDNA